MSEEFKVGDVVQLKSGGENMTIEGVDGLMGIACVWFEGKKVQRAYFNEGTLVKANVGMNVRLSRS